LQARGDLRRFVAGGDDDAYRWVAERGEIVLGLGDVWNMAETEGGTDGLPEPDESYKPGKKCESLREDVRDH
jgi:hypothetical protein